MLSKAVIEKLRLIRDEIKTNTVSDESMAFLESYYNPDEIKQILFVGNNDFQRGQIKEILTKPVSKLINLDELEKRIKALHKPTPEQVVNLITEMYGELNKGT